MVRKKELELETRQIEYKIALDFIMPRHYSGRKPQITKAFGLYENGNLVAVCTFGKPATPRLCEGICGKEYAHCVYELNRLVRVEEFKGQLSQFVSKCLRELKKENWIVVSYADSGMSHHGYIYQACNFLYTGCTKQRTDKYGGGGTQHPRHIIDCQNTVRQIRTSKYRYVYFCTSDKKLKKEWLNHLNYEILPYPKGDNENYILGTIYKPVLVDANRNIIQSSNTNVMKIKE